MESLKKNDDFRNCYRNGRSIANRYLVLYVWKNGLSNNRLGISVSKKVGNSVVRHHFCRLVRESYRHQETGLVQGYDLVVVARTAASDAGYQEISQALLSLAGKADILRDSTPEAD
ncbi:MAG: ribonuclease P protein component [Roseburia faecis]|nr:ribonuclease P protein component [Roseburia faecis]